MKPVVYDVHLCVPSVCVGETVVGAGPGPKKDIHGKQLCERCSRRLSRSKGMKYKCGPGLICQKCHDHEHPRRRPRTTNKRPASPALDDVDAAVEPKRVRRTQSDPGERTNPTRKRIRAEPPAAGPLKKTCGLPTAVDQSHAHRLALLAAVAIDAAHSVPLSS